MLSGNEYDDPTLLCHNEMESMEKIH